MCILGDIDSLEEVGAVVLRRCKEGNSPLFDEENGWRDWPVNAKEKEVLHWLSTVINVIRETVTDEGFGISFGISSFYWSSTDSIGHVKNRLLAMIPMMAQMETSQKVEKCLFPVIDVPIQETKVGIRGETQMFFTDAAISILSKQTTLYSGYRMAKWRVIQLPLYLLG